MKNNMSPANLVARSAAIMGALSACVSAPPLTGAGIFVPF